MVVDTALYDLLGVPPDVNESALKKAYMQKARECHPDKHPDDPEATSKFQAIKEAYDILKDAEKRKKYDLHGLDGLKDDQLTDLEDLLNTLFISSPGNGRHRTNDIVQDLEVTLEEAYNGANKEVPYTRHIPCNQCQGTGTKDGTENQVCENCGGEGRIFVVDKEDDADEEGLDICPDCKGKGEIVIEGNECETCKGDKFIEEQQKMSVVIERGSENGDKIVFHGASDEVPETDTGDLIFIVKEKPHDRFQRKHNDLLFTKKLNLTEALFGAKFLITHLDGRQLIVETDTNTTIQPGHVQVIENEGMPIKGDAFKKGRLFIEYVVELPTHDQINENFKQILTSLIPAVDETKDLNRDSENVFVVNPADSDIKEFNNTKKSKKERRREAYRSSDDEMEYDPEEEEYYEDQQVNCAPM